MAPRILVLFSLLAALSPVGVYASVPAEAEYAPSAPIAHDVGQGYVFLRVYDDSLVVRLEANTQHLNATLGLGWDPGAPVTLAQIQANLEAIRGYMEPRFALSTSDGPLELAFRDFSERELIIGEFVLLEYLIEGIEGIPDLLDLHYSAFFENDRNHRNFLIVEYNWKTATFNNESIISLIFSPGAPDQTLDLSRSSVLNGFLGLIRLGAQHIWIGIDHLLFLLALVLPSVMFRDAGTWKPVPKFRTAFINIVTIVTFFTIAHSVTLGLAGLDIVRLPSRFVESVIALSIAIAAWANLVPRLEVKEWTIAFAFGLFHGFGFASVLGDIGLGSERLVGSLLGFNLGVELGQLAVISVVFPALFLVRKSKFYPSAMRTMSYLLIAIALLWFGERVLNVDVPLVPIVLAPFRWMGGLIGLGA